MQYRHEIGHAPASFAFAVKDWTVFIEGVRSDAV